MINRMISNIGCDHFPRETIEVGGESKDDGRRLHKIRATVVGCIRKL